MPQDHLSPLLSQALGNLQFELLKSMAEKQYLQEALTALQQENETLKKAAAAAT